MAKRRNLKKEKAQRNLAYARKFRKRRGNSNRYRRSSRPSDSENNEESNENSEDNTSNRS